MAYSHGFERFAGPSVTSTFIEDERYRMKFAKVQWLSDICSRERKVTRLSLINEALSHEDVWVSGDIPPLLLTSTLDGCE
jgi:hypothetical protein